MTSARTRDRLIQRLQDQGITNLSVLDRIRNVPRHLFVDEALAKRAKATLKELGIKNVMLKHGDGTVGWKSQKPFDGILVAAAPLAVPEALFTQLANKGRLIVPVGPEGAQQLIRFTRRDQHIE